MSGEVNYKKKYMELKAKFMESVEMAFRLGFEDGAKQSQQDQAMQQQQQMEQQQAAMNGAVPGQEQNPSDPNGGGSVPGQDQGATMPAGPGMGIQQGGPAPQGAQPMKESEHPDGSELEQHIAKLESMISKTEDLDVGDLKKAIGDLRTLQKAQKEQIELRKSAMAIPAIAKALHTPKFKIGVQASHNMNSTAKAAVTMQHKIVNDIMAKWENEEKNASKDILSQLNVEGLTKKE